MKQDKEQLINNEDFIVEALYLSNALMYTLPFVNSLQFPGSSERANKQSLLHSYISEHGTQPLGPLIIKTAMKKNNISESTSIVTYIQQTAAFISNVKSPYKMKKVLIIPNCVHKKISGDLGELIYLYYKIAAQIGFEKMSPSKEIYTFSISQNCEDNHTTVEVYIPIQI